MTTNRWPPGCGSTGQLLAKYPPKIAPCPVQEQCPMLCCRLNIGNKFAAICIIKTLSHNNGGRRDAGGRGNARQWINVSASGRKFFLGGCPNYLRFASLDTHNKWLLC